MRTVAGWGHVSRGVVRFFSFCFTHQKTKHRFYTNRSSRVPEDVVWEMLGAERLPLIGVEDDGWFEVAGSVVPQDDRGVFRRPRRGALERVLDAAGLWLLFQYLGLSGRVHM